MSRKIAVGIDVGTHQIKVVVSENIKSKDGSYSPIVLAKSASQSGGLRNGYVTDIDETTKSIREAIAQAEKIAKIKIKKVYLSVGGIGLGSIVGKGSVMISKADSEITDLDIKKVLVVAENELPTNLLTNKKIIHTVPLAYKIDDESLIGRPKGMHGTKLETKALFVVCLEQHLNDLISAVENAGVNVVDVMASPFAGSLVNLSKTQKMAGSILINIGSETTSFVVYENNVPISLEVIPTGGSDITNDIALNFKIPIDEAENIKMSVENSEQKYSKKKLFEIIVNRLHNIFESVESHLKKIGRNGLLPAGIVLTGGGAEIESIESTASEALKLSAKKATINLISDPRNSQMKDLSWSVAYGLSIWGLSYGEDVSFGKSSSLGLIDTASKWFQKFLP